ncbi:MAG: helix-turn-helix domain-containing protein [Planctomycetota bacterium]
MTIHTNASDGRAVGLDMRPVENAELLSVGAVAKLLDCSARHIYRMSDAGKMPRPVKLGQLVRWKRRGGPTDSIEGWLDAGCPSVRSARGAR